jgi:signal transduction histidine kinase
MTCSTCPRSRPVNSSLNSPIIPSRTLPITVRSTLEPLAADKKLAFKVELATELPPGRGDGRRLTQVLINLVGNAIKFTDAGEVAIKAEANNGAFYVSARDTGPGISAADQAKLFQEFQQADNAITRKKGGTGLGLAISKRIIEMHGGKIWVESQPSATDAKWNGCKRKLPTRLNAEQPKGVSLVSTNRRFDAGERITSRGTCSVACRKRRRRLSASRSACAAPPKAKQ